VRQLAVVLAFAGVTWCGVSPVAGSEDSALAQRIESASGVLLSGPHPSRTATQEALADLLQSASGISAAAGFPAPTQERLDSVVALYEGGGFLEPENVAAVHRAYESVTGGRAFVFPQSVSSIEEARDHGRLQIQKALGALDAGRPKEAVQEVLGFVLMVTTPMKQER